jgi:hypothetical protein
MKKVIFSIIFLTFLAFTLTSRGFFSIEGSTNIVDVNITEIPIDYNKIELGVPITGIISQSSSPQDYGLSITANDNLIQYLTYEKSDDTLRIYLDPVNNYNNIKVTANITLPNLTFLKADVSADVDISEFIEQNMIIEANTSAVIEASNMTIYDTLMLDFNTSAIGFLTDNYVEQDIDIKSTTSAEITISGSGNPDLSIDAGTSSKIDLEDIIVYNADIKLSTSAQSDITMNGGILNADLGTSSILRVYGTYTPGEINIGTSAELIYD